MPDPTSSIESEGCDPQPSVISLGGGVKLLSIDHYLRASSGAWNADDFELLCKKLGVPLVAIGSTLYVEPLVFESIFSARLLPGSPNFNTPGSERAKLGGTTGLNPKNALQDFDLALEVLMKRRKIYGATVSREIRNLLGRGSRSLLRHVEESE